MTRREFMDRAVADLTAAGVESPVADAEWLLAATTGQGRLQWRLDPQNPLPEDVKLRLGERLARRRAREPLAQILGEQAFLGSRILVNRHTLIPRPETEQLAITAIEIARRLPGNIRILDWGAGSGCLAICLAAALPDARILAVDLSAEALALAEENVRRHGVAGRVECLSADRFQAEPRPAGFDLIVTNPPYIPSAVIDELAPEVRCFEPRLALDGGGDGLDCFRILAGQAPEWLKPGGWLAAEFGDGQAPALRVLFSLPNWAPGDVRKDLSGRERLFIVERRQGAAVAAPTLAPD